MIYGDINDDDDGVMMKCDDERIENCECGDGIVMRITTNMK